MWKAIRDLPKIELHAHLNGCIRRETLLDFLAEEGRSETFSYKMDMAECFRIFGIIHSVMQTPEKVMRITKEILEDFEAENTVYLELRTTPKRTPHMTKTENLNAITEALRAYTGKMITKLIISVNRAQSIADARENIDLAKTIEECVGIEFSGNPGVNKFEDFKEIFQYARDQGFKISIHTAEEPDHEDTMAILRFAPERLGHCNYLEPEAEDLILSSRIPIEICASSNMLTMNMDNLLNHHFGRFHASGHPLSICTDDTLLVNSTITKEYFMLAQTFNLTIQDMQKIIRDSAEMAFTPGVLEKVGFFLTTQN